ncbi:membrane protein [Thiomicrorhabdus immobilis]|uniref:Membrane protein n=1 Tax=Thiomicrorhabdus immobilis TaxID=2791037 RepID=A0ABM7MDB5_9GAMM|nr:M23 family metallopeptidase [Thiomicrorhabdus immobilis]BCN93410.1 membrane protein [Thiomicrorhabdus immobilis]
MNLYKQPVLKLTTLLTASLMMASCSSPTKYEPRHSTAGEKQTQRLQNTHSCHSPYRVVSGDTLSGIAVKCDSTIAAIAKNNELLPPYIIYVNQELVLPINEEGVPAETAVVSADTHSSKEIEKSKQLNEALTPKSVIVKESPSSRPKVVEKETTATAIVRNEPQTAKKTSSNKNRSWIWPMHKGLAYKYLRDNAGLSILEIYGVPGQKIKAVAPGKVVYSGNGIINYGWMLVIKHDNDYMSIYAHNSALLVKEGDYVESGQEVALMGATGNTKRPKLYLEARYQGRKVDIKKVLKYK